MKKIIYVAFALSFLTSCKSDVPEEITDVQKEVIEEIDAPEGVENSTEITDTIIPEPEPIRQVPVPPEPVPPGPMPDPYPDPEPEPIWREEIPPVPFSEPVQVVQEEIVDFPEEPATYPGGEAELMKFIQENIVYPEIEREMGNQGKVYVRFVVEKDGSVTNVEVMRGVSMGLDREAKRVVRLLPKFNPAKLNGKPVRSRYAIPVIFRLT